MLQGLETYIESEKFLHTLEAVSAEWIDLSDNQQPPHKGGSPHVGNLEMELQQVRWRCIQCMLKPCFGLLWCKNTDWWIASNSRLY